MEQIYAKIYISETAHTAYCPGQHCTVRGLEFGVWEKTENDHRKKVSQGEEKSKEKVCDHHTPQSMQSLLRRPLSDPVVGLKIQGRRASCNVVAIICPTPPWFSRLNWSTKSWRGKWPLAPSVPPALIYKLCWKTRSQMHLLGVLRIVVRLYYIVVGNMTIKFTLAPPMVYYIYYVAIEQSCCYSTYW